MLKEVDYLIIEEYFLNGFNKPKAFKKYKNNYKTQNSSDIETYKFVAATANLSSIVLSYSYKF